ncbi:MAG: hypothetical protein U1F16_03120 [Turneriella sp.]
MRYWPALLMLITAPPLPAEIAGPRPMPPLKEEHEYDFFGDKTGVTKDKGIILIPKARGYSFESLLSDK